MSHTSSTEKLSIKEAIITNNRELCHHGVKGMKWGVRRYRKKDSSSNPEGQKKQQDADTTKNRKPLLTDAQKQSIKRGAAKTVAKGVEVASKLMLASAVDDIFYGGVGKKIAKEAVVQTGRAAVTAYTMARGGYDIKWYDKNGRRVG